MAYQMRASTPTQFAAIFFLFAIGGCDSSGSSRPGQSLATVDGSDITVHQLNAELNGLAATDEKPAALQRKALDQLIDRKLLAGQALKAGIDRDPAVMLQIERSRQQILSQAYLQSLASRSAKPGRAEIDAYIHQHPALFAHGKLYDFHYLALQTQALSAEVKAMVERAGSVEELAPLLAARRVAFAESRAYRSSQELPAALLSHLDTVSGQRVFVMRDGAQTLLASLTYVKDAPVTGDEAAMQVEQYLAARAAAGMAKDEVAHLRQTASISYARDGAAAAPAPAPDIRAADGTPAAKTNATIENGIAGLH
jgi:peptidyl-prolyl cis-trans isomerase C